MDNLEKTTTETMTELVPVDAADGATTTEPRRRFSIIGAVVGAIRKRRRVSIAKACRVLRKIGLSPVVSGNEIHWVCNGKESVLKIRNLCQVEIARVYDIPPVPAAVHGHEKAAMETMKEVYLAKVAVLEGEGRCRLAFSAESLCVSGRELSVHIPMCIQILDMAESRQHEHLLEMRNARSQRRRIGFLHADGEVR